MRRWNWQAIRYFNSRPSARGDSRPPQCRFLCPISIHAPPRGATGRHENLISRHSISIHAPPRGATAVPCEGSGMSRFQFTPLREGRRPEPCHQANEPISIHAPPRGATSAGGGGGHGEQISIHAPPRGATRLPHHWHFQRGNISIHAPPRGATLPASYFTAPALFQFTPLREGRPDGRAGARRGQNFNSRPSARGDGFVKAHGRRLCYFNSRPSARGDLRVPRRS